MGASAHRAGTEQLLRWLLSEVGASALSPHLERWLGDGASLPAGPDPGLKHDLYLAQVPGGRGWGLTTNTRWERGPEALLRRTEGVLRTLAPSGRHDLVLGSRVVERLHRAGVDLCVGLGFDAGAREPRVKLYLQEERWGGGLLDSAEWADFTREHGFGGDLPGSLPSPGVLSLSLHADGRHHWKLYLGGPTAEAASAGAPEAARSLAVDMARSCPLQPAWHYLSLRVRPGAAPEFAMNRIIDHAHWGLHGGAGRRALIWTEALAFLARGPARDMAPSWRRASARPGLLVVPTALALEAGGADLYAGAWELSSSS